MVVQGSTSDSITNTPSTSISEEETEAFIESTQSSSYASDFEIAMNSGISGAAEESADAASISEEVAEGLAEAGVEEAVASGLNPIGVAIGVAALVLAGVAMVLTFILKNEHCSLDILNKTDGDLVFNPDNPEDLYIAHGKQSGAPVGNVIAAGTGGNSELGIYMFSSKEDALYGTGGAIRFTLNASGGPLAVQIAWGVPYSGSNWCNVLIGSVTSPAVPLAAFYDSSNKAKETVVSSSSGGYTIQASISSAPKERATGTVIAVVMPT